MNERQKHPKRPRDINLRAASTVALATGETEEAPPEIKQVFEATPEERHAAAVTLGKKGGQARAKKLTPEQRKEIGQKAALARWHK
ncbi:MAG: RNA-binding protein [Patescibacteria group bacterium]